MIHVSTPESGLLLAAFSEYKGQGLCYESDVCIAYDTDLTNKDMLKDATGQDKADTGALLVSLYRKYGLEFLDRLRGAFAFVIWDKSQKRLVVVTDFYGVRPVVFSHSSGRYAAASRIRTLKLNADLSHTINPDAIYHYLFFQAVCSPLTIYKDISKLGPGKGHDYINGKLNEFQYYDIRYKPDLSYNEPHWRQRIFDEVEKAVDVFVPLNPNKQTGCFLSGGTDSSTLAGLYTKLSGEPANTFSIGFDDPQYNELEYATLAVDKFGTSQTEYYVTPEDTLDLVSDLCRIYDEPFGNASVVAAFYCAAKAKAHGINVMLGGDGGDEIFGGNERYVTNLVFFQVSQDTCSFKETFA